MQLPLWVMWEGTDLLQVLNCSVLHWILTFYVIYPIRLLAKAKYDVFSNGNLDRMWHYLCIYSAS